MRMNTGCMADDGSVAVVIVVDSFSEYSSSRHVLPLYAHPEKFLFFLRKIAKIAKLYSATRNQDKSLVTIPGGVDSINLSVRKWCRSMSLGVMPRRWHITSQRKCADPMTRYRRF